MKNPERDFLEDDPDLIDIADHFSRADFFLKTGFYDPDQLHWFFEEEIEREYKRDTAYVNYNEYGGQQ